MNAFEMEGEAKKINKMKHDGLPAEMKRPAGLSADLIFA